MMVIVNTAAGPERNPASAYPAKLATAAGITMHQARRRPLGRPVTAGIPTTTAQDAAATVSHRRGILPCVVVNITNVPTRYIKANARAKRNES